jgi:hypothetical protein
LAENQQPTKNQLSVFGPFFVRLGAKRHQPTPNQPPTKNQPRPTTNHHPNPQLFNLSTFQPVIT